MMPDTSRTHGEAVMDVRYGVRFNVLCERFYDRLDFAFGACTLLGGSAALASLINKSPDLAAVAGAVLTSLAIVGRLLGLGRRAERHQFAKKAYAELDAEAPDLPLAELDKKLKRLQGASPSGVAGLAMVAVNDTLKTHGYESSVRALNRWEKLLSWIV